MATPYIVFVTANIPAAVAAVNVIGLQSECEMLAERSALLVRILGGRRDFGADAGDATHHAASHPSGHGTSHDKAMAFLAGQGRKLGIVYDPRGKSIPPAPTSPTVTEGGNVLAAECLLARLVTSEENASGSHAGKVLHFTEGCAEIFVQEVAEWSVPYAKELVEP